MPADLTSLLRLEVPLIVRLAEHAMPVEQVVALVPGSIIELAKPADEDLEILVNNKPIGRGFAVKVGENYGVRVSRLGDARRRLEAAGLDEAPAPEPAPASEPEPEPAPEPDAAA